MKCISFFSKILSIFAIDCKRYKFSPPNHSQLGSGLGGEAFIFFGGGREVSHNPVKYLYSSRESVKPNLRAMRWRFFLQYSGVILSKRAISFDDRLI